jgi:putative aminopeptidase FrvX
VRNMSRSLELLKELSEAHGAPGHEEEIKAIFLRELKGLGEVIEDKIGGCAVRLKNSSKQGRKIFLGAHFDEVGFMVQNIRPDGSLQFINLGGWWGHTVMSQRLKIRSRKNGKDFIGIVCSIPPHLLGAQKDRVLDVGDMFIDVGAKSKAEVEKMGIQLGDPIVPDSNFSHLHSDLYIGKAFDNRSGVAATIEAAKELSKTKLNAQIYVGCTVQEEMGLRGAKTLAYSLGVDDAILLEGAPADDTPGLNPLDSQTKVGGGVQIRLMDSSAIMSRNLVDQVLKVADKKKISTQIAVRKSGGTDAGSFLLAKEGSRCCVLATPCRYIHTHNAMMSLKDYEQTIKLSVEVVKDISK